jgi:hypothetical protein
MALKERLRALGESLPNTSDWLVVAGTVCLTMGGRAIYEPLVWIIPGAVCVGWGILRERL